MRTCERYWKLQWLHKYCYDHDYIYWFIFWLHHGMQKQGK